MIDKILSKLVTPLEKIQDWREYRNSWEEVESELKYEEVIKRANGYTVNIYKRTTYKNTMDGSTKQRVREEYSKFVGSQWIPGRPVEYNNDLVFCADDANLFGNVARGYQI